MPINEDLSDLPRGGPPPPPEQFHIGRQVIPVWLKGALAHWMDELDSGPRAKAVEGTTWRSSWSASRCNRQLAYQLTDTKEDTPFDLADFWRTNLGKVIGARFVEHIDAALQDDETNEYRVTAEVPADLRQGVLNLDGSSSIEILIDVLDPVGDRWEPFHIVEIKTINGMGFKEVALGWKSGRAKPRFGHVVQTCVEAAHYGVDATLIYLATELIGSGIAKSKGLQPLQRFTTAWRFSAEECRKVAELERERIYDVLEQINSVPDTEPMPVPRVLVAPGDIPAGAVITNPDKGMWVVLDTKDDGGIVDSGSTWFCDYCGFRKTCVRDGA